MDDDLTILEQLADEISGLNVLAREATDPEQAHFIDQLATHMRYVLTELSAKPWALRGEMPRWTGSTRS